MYWETLLASMGMFGDKRGHFGGKCSSGLVTLVAGIFSGLF